MADSYEERDLFVSTAERKYYSQGNIFIKRSLRPAEWKFSPFQGKVHVPRLGNERLFNEAEAMRYVAEHTSIPVPKLHCAFMDDEAVYLVLENIQGVSMDELSAEQREVVNQELLGHIRSLHALRSRNIGGPSGLVIPPYRVMCRTSKNDWKLRAAETEEYVFCHNDLSQQNVIVDPETLRVKAILDWEYAGFYPEFFDRQFFRRLGPSVALERYNEEDDTERLLEFLMSQLLPELSSP